MNTPLSLEIAKLLKEKGFNKPCLSYYSYLNIYTVELRDWNNQTIGDTDIHERNAGYYSAPTIAEVVMWLYEKYGIWISVVDVNPEQSSWEYQISKKGVGLKYSSGQYPAKYDVSPTEAYEAAITYTLNNLI